MHSIYADEFFKWVYPPFLTLLILVRHFFQRVSLDGPLFRSFSHMPLIHFIFSSGIIPAFFSSVEFSYIVNALHLALFTDRFQFLDISLRGLRPSPRGLRPSCYDTPAISYSLWDYWFFANIGLFLSWLRFFRLPYSTYFVFVTFLHSLPLQDLFGGSATCLFIQVLAAGPFSFVTPSCGGAVDGYLQWCTTFVRTAQGTYGALAQSLICSC